MGLLNQNFLSILVQRVGVIAGGGEIPPTVGGTGYNILKPLPHVMRVCSKQCT